MQEAAAASELKEELSEYTARLANERDEAARKAEQLAMSVMRQRAHWSRFPMSAMKRHVLRKSWPRIIAICLSSIIS